MPWPIPTAATIAERIAGALEIVISRKRPDLSPVAISRAVRSEKGNLAQIGRVVAIEAQETHDHIAYWSRQIFVDSVEDEMVLRHAAIWGIDQRPAAAAIGAVTIEGVAGKPIPAGLVLTASDARQYRTTEAVAIGEDGTVEAPAAAAVAGLAGNIEAGIRLVTLAPFPEISRVTVSGEGFAGGIDEESLEELRAAVLEHIRQRPHGGAGFDYQFWISRQFAIKAVGIAPDWIGRGSVGLVVVMRDADGAARVPTDPERAAMLAYLGAPGSAVGVRPVTAHVVVVAATLQPVPISVRLRPDTTATRAAVAAAFARYIATLGDADDTDNASPIGARIEPSRVSEAISSASGEYAHDLILPAAPYTLGATQYPVAGTITWVAA